MKPIGALQQIGRKFVRIAKWEDADALERFIAGDEFIRLFATVPATMRVNVIKSYLQARQSCRQGPPVPAAGTRKAKWDALTVKRFETLWAKYASAGHAHKAIARKVGAAMQITEGAARVAYSRFIKHGAPATRGVVENASRKPQEARLGPRLSMGARPHSESVRVSQAAA